MSRYRRSSCLARAAGVVLLLGAMPAISSAQVMDAAKYLFVLADEFEGAPKLSGRPFLMEIDAWYGGSRDRLWLKVDADANTVGQGGDIEAQILFSRLVAPYWDLQLGVRADGRWGESDRARAHLALGLRGLAPYWFEVEAALFVSAEGDVSGSVQAGYDLLLSQRLVLEPEIEANLSFQDVPEWSLRSGINDVELALRLRYEIRREVAPYLGWAWHRTFGGTAQLIRDAGEPWKEGSLIAGIRAWY